MGGSSLFVADCGAGIGATGWDDAEGVSCTDDPFVLFAIGPLGGPRAQDAGLKQGPVQVASSRSLV